MKKEFLVNRQGKDFVLYAGLLDQAHQEGLKRISTRVFQAPADDNGQLAIVIAEVETEKGIFTGIGDASPQNVGRMIAPHLLRMAETRAKARALRDAINIGATALEELADVDDELAPRRVDRATGEINPAADQRAATPENWEQLRKAAAALKRDFGVDVTVEGDALTVQGANDLLGQWRKRYAEERRKAAEKQLAGVGS